MHTPVNVTLLVCVLGRWRPQRDLLRLGSEETFGRRPAVAGRENKKKHFRNCFPTVNFFEKVHGWVGYVGLVRVQGCTARGVMLLSSGSVWYEFLIFAT